MKHMWDRISEFLWDEDGPTATEYSVMLALIIVACVASIQLIGDKVTNIFTNVQAGLPDAVAGSGS